MLLPTFAIIFGFLDLGFVIFTWNTLQNAVREGTRYAITMQTQSGVGQVQSIKNKTSQWTIGFVNPNSTSTSGTYVPYVDVKFYDPADSTNTPLTGAGSNNPGNIVEVSIKNYPYRWMFPLTGSFAGVFYATPGSALTLAVYSVDVLGGTGLGLAPTT
jgi:Flp pilus assembly protein TadG